MDSTDSRVSQLNRQATEAKKQGDMNQAVALLKQVKELLGDYYEDTRLALFLQQAGQFDEAMKEFERLLAAVEWQVWESLAHAPEVSKQSSIASKKERIHQKIKLACEREKKPELAEKHALLAAQYFAEWKELSEVAHAIRLSKLEAYQTANESRKTHPVLLRQYLDASLKEKDKNIAESLKVAKRLRTIYNKRRK